MLRVHYVKLPNYYQRYYVGKRRQLHPYRSWLTASMTRRAKSQFHFLSRKLQAEEKFLFPFTACLFAEEEAALGPLLCADSPYRYVLRFSAYLNAGRQDFLQFLKTTI